MEVPMRTKSSQSGVLSITKSIPVPAYAVLGRAIKNTLAALKPGESFEVPVAANKALAYRMNKYGPRTFTLKTTKGKIRVWKL
jgi:hypothetical protein